MNIILLMEQLKKHEGYSATPYRCPSGKLTIGWGRNLDDVGISEDEAFQMLMNDIERAHDACVEIFGERFFDERLPEPWQHVLLNMAFNLGEAGLRSFRNMIAAILAEDFPRAILEMIDSRWYGQVGARAEELVEMVETHEMQSER